MRLFDHPESECEEQRAAFCDILNVKVCHVRAAINCIRSKPQQMLVTSQIVRGVAAA